MQTFNQYICYYSKEQIIKPANASKITQVLKWWALVHLKTSVLQLCSAIFDSPCVCLADHTIKRTKEKLWYSTSHLQHDWLHAEFKWIHLVLLEGVVCCPAVAPDARLPCETCRRRDCALPAAAAAAAMQSQVLRHRRRSSSSSCRSFPSLSFRTRMRNRWSHVCASGLAFGFAPNWRSVLYFILFFAQHIASVIGQLIGLAGQPASCVADLLLLGKSR